MYMLYIYYMYVLYIHKYVLQFPLLILSRVPESTNSP